MKIRKLLITSVLFLQFSNLLYAKEINHSVGIGLQYSGIFGYQISIDNVNHRFRGSIGLVGVGIGYDYFISPKWSLGVTLTETIRTVHSININYYATSQIEGFRFGLDLGHMPNAGDEGYGYFISEGSKNVVFAGVGYTF